MFKMGLQLCLIILSLLNFCLCFPYGSNSSDIQLPCPDYGKIEYGKVKMMRLENYAAVVHIECAPGYDLIGKQKFLCTDGQWDRLPRPKCIPKDLCLNPPDLINGKITLEGEKDTAGLYKKGTLVTYSCSDGYRLLPPETKYRVCEKGIWTGALGKCVPNGCKAPKDIANGYYVSDKNGVIQDYNIGQRVYYSCFSGYVLKGPLVQQCIDDGTWSPRIPPSCPLEINVDDLNDFSCRKLPVLSHVEEKLLRGNVALGVAMPDTEVALRCTEGYINTASATPCEDAILRCTAGIWIGDLPTCEVVKKCTPPPEIPNAHLHLVPNRSNRHSQIGMIGTEAVYECLTGFEFRSSTQRLLCSITGCWEGAHPVCFPEGEFVDEYMPARGTVLMSVETAAVVMLMLISVCFVVTCRRRKWYTNEEPGVGGLDGPRPHGSSTGVSVSAADSSSALIDDPDRLALIAFADGLQVGQNAGLPSYEEAIRERASGHGLLGYRPHRPHWPALGGRRGRGTSVCAGDTLITRQSSCTSHSASMRSGSAGGPDPMGSTDTMTTSEVSTNVTLDTVSSHSGSQPASCRAICGSLASFDTSSVINTEGVPLLEENEMEESPTAETGSISMADNASFKNHRTSPDLA